MALSLQGWLGGVSATGLVIGGSIIGLYVIYESKKTNAKLLFILGLQLIFSSLGWLGNLVDFVTILITGKNMNNTYGTYIILSMVWFPFTVLCFGYISLELIIPEKKLLKRLILSIYLGLALICELFLFLDPMGSFTFYYPTNSGEDLIDESIVFTSAFGILFIIFTLSGFIFVVFGFIFKGIQSTGVIRKKLLLLSMGFILFIVFASLDISIPPGIGIIFTRLGVLSCYWILYLGLREEPEKKEKIKTKKEVKVEGDLFRISQYKKEDITEEEVSISKEKKICLVCKGKLARYNIYICPECDTFYCEKCGHALENLENSCWTCGAPIDESKPVKPFKKEDEEIEDIEISEKPQKKPKTK